MASNERVGWALSVLKHLPSKQPISAETVAFYALGLDDVTDQALTVAVRRAAAECTFLPTPAELRALAGLNRVALDIEPVLDRISALASYLPTTGTTYPRVEAVRQHFGDGVAEAYSLAGGARVFSPNETTREIARREFAAALRDVVRVFGAQAVLAPVATVKALPGSGAAVVFGQRPEAASGPMRLSAGLSRLVGRVEQGREGGDDGKL